MADHKAAVDGSLLTRGTSNLELGARETSRVMTEMKYVFVCGLHRSGTTVLAQQIGELKNCTGFGSTGAGLFLDEGQYLQDVYPPDTSYGGVGRFGFSPQTHLTECSPLLTSKNIFRLRRSWESCWDSKKKICVEKTPGNLLKTRFLQAAFPNAYFVVIKRHPVAVSLATQKWSLTPLHELFEHWLQCHKIFDEDKKQLNRLYELSYEDYIENPRKYLEEIANFIGTELSGSFEEQAADGYNKKYFDRWTRMLQSSVFKAYYRCVAEDYEEQFREAGYSLAPPTFKTTFSPHEVEPARRFFTPLLYLGAASFFALWRAGRWLRIRVWHTLQPKSIQAFTRDQKTKNDPI